MEEFNPKEIARDIAKRVTALRLQKAWTREVLAEQSGVNVYTLKHFERTGQISLHRLIAISSALEVNTEVERLFKPRHRVDVDNWSLLEPQTTRKRGRRRKPQVQTTVGNVESMVVADSAATPIVESIEEVS